MKKKEIKYIVYTSRNEILVTTPKGEQGLLHEYFTEGGRDLDDYDREETDKDVIAISSQTRIQL